MKSSNKFIIAAALVSVGGVAAAGAFAGPMLPAPVDTTNVVRSVDMGPGGERGWGRHGGERGHHGMRHGAGAGGPGGWGGPMGMHGGGPRGGMMMMVLREADTDEDGALSQDEINAFIQGKVDLGDADGNGEVTLQEFEAIWLDFTRRPMVRTFQFFDENGDAVISAEEIDSHFGDVVKRMDRNEDGVLNRDDRPRHHARHDRDHRRKGDFGKRRAGPDEAQGESDDD